MADRKQIARDLDRAAARADLVGATPATGKQCWFLAGLIAEAGEDADGIGCGCLDTNAVLTKRAASQWIEQYLGERSARTAA